MSFPEGDRVPFKDLAKKKVGKSMKMKYVLMQVILVTLRAPNYNSCQLTQDVQELKYDSAGFEFHHQRKS